MSEVKGSLLGIVLAISVFSIVFAIITLAIKNTSETVSGRMEEAVGLEADAFSETSAAYTLHY